MNSDFLGHVLHDKPYATLQQINNEKASSKAPEGTSRLSFEMLSELGEVIGHVKTWHNEDGYAGFVHFDPEGNIIDWNAFTKDQYSRARN